MHSQARRGAVGCPMVSGDLPRGRSVGHTHTLEEEGEGPPSLSGINRQRQPGGAPAQAGAQDGSPAEHGLRARRRHHAAAGGTGRAAYLPVPDALAAARPRSTTGPSNPGLPEAAAAAPGEEGRGRAARRRSSSHVRRRWFFPAVSVLPATARMMVVVASRQLAPPARRRPSSSLSPREEEPNHPPPPRQRVSKFLSLTVNSYSSSSADGLRPKSIDVTYTTLTIARDPRK